MKLTFDIDQNGNVSNLQLASSSGHDILDQAALDTVKKWDLPSSENGRLNVSQSLTFAIKGSDLARQARERRDRQAREREQKEQERLARERRGRQESLAREQEQKEQERLARELQQREQKLREQIAPEPSNLQPLAPQSAPVEPSPLAPVEEATPLSVPAE